MARRRKKSKGYKPAPPPASPAAQAATSAGQKGAAEQATPQVSAGKHGLPTQALPGIRPATCMAGMFLTLVLGIYLGTLLPDLMHGLALRPMAPTREEPDRGHDKPQAKLDPDLAALTAELEKKANASPNSAPDWINLGNIYFDGFQPSKAIAAYERALKLAPKNADVWTDLGIMQREVGNYDKAVECFRQAIEINPRHENAMFNEGVVLANDLDKNKEAAAAWQRLLDVNPGARAPNGKSVSEMIRSLQ